MLEWETLTFRTGRTVESAIRRPLRNREQVDVRSVLLRFGEYPQQHGGAPPRLMNGHPRVKAHPPAPERRPPGRASRGREVSRRYRNFTHRSKTTALKVMAGPGKALGSGFGFCLRERRVDGVGGLVDVKVIVVGRGALWAMESCASIQVTFCSRHSGVLCASSGSARGGS